MDLERTIIKAVSTIYPKHYEPHHPRGLYRVKYLEPISLRKAIYQFATYFRREFQYDFVQYSIEPEPNYGDKNTWAYLIGEPLYDHRLGSYGACCFRWRDKWTNLEPHWALQWIWIHPYKRNNGLLSKYWPFLEEKFGNFMVEDPLSKAMEYFLKNRAMQHDHQYEGIKKEESCLT